jgi:predicted dehydrogenase
LEFSGNEGRPLDHVTAVIVGAGHRAVTYASYAERHPDELKIVGVADPNARRRQQMAQRFGFGPDRCYESAEQLPQAGKIADGVINGTMDHQHVETAVPLLEAGYDMLLEKPFATNREEMWKLANVAKAHNRKVMICHVLRYAPFYAAIRNRVAGGDIGQLVNVQTIEHVSYHHMGVGFVRGEVESKGSVPFIDVDGQVLPRSGFDYVDD